MHILALNYLLQHTSLTMHRHADQILQERLGIGMAQFKILTILHERSEIQQRFLAATLGQTEAGISRQMKLLLKKDLLSVQINPVNKREHVATLTAKGMKFTQAAREIVDEYHASALGLLGERERRQLTEVLQQLHSHCCRQDKPFACDVPWPNPN